MCEEYGDKEEEGWRMDEGEAVVHIRSTYLARVVPVEFF
jgi:hypothetical protein